MSIQAGTANMSKVPAFKHSPFGVASLIIALLNNLYFVLVIFLSKFIDQKNVLYKLFDIPDSLLFLLTWCFVGCLGTIFCMIGVKKDQKKAFSLLGLLLGAPIFCFLFIGIMLFETNLIPAWLR